MDGNGRWATKRGLPKIAGHREGVKAVERVIRAAVELGVKVLTLYTFSTENWKRPRFEVDALFGLIEEYLDREADKLHKNNMRFSVIGRIDGLPGPVAAKVRRVMEMTGKNTGLMVNLALNYGGRSEIVDACRAIASDAAKGAIDPDTITEESFARYLYTRDLPDPDLMIRTSGEFRISNFLLWQLSYAEFVITEKFWPDFTGEDLADAVREYEGRARRYGR